MFFIRESYPAVRVPVASEQRKAAERTPRFVEFDKFLREAFPGTATDGLWLKPSQAMI